MTPEQEAQLLRIQEPPMEGWMTHERACVLFHLVERWEPERIVLLGTFGGRDVIALALACKSIGKGMVFGVDAWKLEPCLEGENEAGNDEWWAKMDWAYIKKHFYEKIQEFDVVEHVVQFARHDLEVVEFFQDGIVDMIIFDTNHASEPACRTVRSWFPKVRPGGIMVMDDLDWKGQSEAEKLLVELGSEPADVRQQWGVYRKLPVMVSDPVENVLETA